jgi:hypothetical protein
MYQSELVLRTRTGETFRELLSRLLADCAPAPFFAGLHAVTATGHLEHHHAGNPVGGNGGANTPDIGHGHGGGHNHEHAAEHGGDGEHHDGHS